MMMMLYSPPYLTCEKIQAQRGEMTRQDVKLIFTRGHISLAVAFKGPDVMLALYKCNYSLTVK